MKQLSWEQLLFEIFKFKGRFCSNIENLESIYFKGLSVHKWIEFLFF